MARWLRPFTRHRSTEPGRDVEPTRDPAPQDWRQALRPGRRDDVVAVFVALVVTAAFVLGGIALIHLISGLFS